jgi:aspartate racemase
MNQYKKIGIIGGVSWISTLEYYQAICEMSHRCKHGQKQNGPAPIPEMTIESLNINKSISLRGRPGDDESWLAFEAYFRKALNRLEASDVDFAIIASNTPHNRFDQITERIGIPVLNIFEEVAKTCVKENIVKALILGTEPTMSSQVFPDVLRTHGISGILPNKGVDQDRVISLIGLLQAEKSNRGSELIQDLAGKYLQVTTDERSAVCLSCTELSLAFPEHLDVPIFDIIGITYINTIQFLANADFFYEISHNTRLQSDAATPRR